MELLAPRRPIQVLASDAPFNQSHSSYPLDIETDCPITTFAYQENSRCSMTDSFLPPLCVIVVVWMNEIEVNRPLMNSFPRHALKKNRLKHG